VRKVPKKWIRNASDHYAIEEGCYFDDELAGAVVEFIETFCKQSKGRWVGQPLTLQEWQRDFVMRAYGWRMPDGTRRFTSIYLEVAKKNGKSTLASALANRHIVDVDDGAPEIYLNAVDREQAGIVFDEAARMVKASPELSGRLMIVASKGRIIDPVGNGKIQRNSADAPSKDGVNASLTIFDEIHRFKSRELWDVFRYAGAAREQPLKFIITTAGDEEEGIWFELRTHAEAVNDGTRRDIRFLGVVYRADPTDDIESPATWKKANPSLGVTLTEADFRQDLESAKNNPAEMQNFLRLRLNIVAKGESKFVDMVAWDACAAPFVMPSRPSCWQGLDLSENEDLTALVSLVRLGDSLFGITADFWLPRENIVDLERRHQQPYRQWAQMGLITLTPGNVVDYAFVRKQINALAGKYDLRKLAMDPYHAVKLGTELEQEDGLPVETIRQGFLSLSDPTKQLLRMILGKQLRHGGNPIMRWHASNAVAETDAAGNIKLNKKKSKKKIDGMAALVNAIAAYTGADDDSGPSVYETRGIQSIRF
jgi:phage terminase large subunit-like protein